MSANDNHRPPTALITGASKGLGLTLARFLAARGYNLIINARNVKTLSQAGKSLPDQAGVVRAVTGDISEAVCRRQLAAAVRSFGHLDLLINNASALGPLPMPALAHFPLDGLRQVLEVNTIAPLALVQEMLPFLAASGGLVVNLSSDAANGGYEHWGGYGASKAALDLFSVTLANELRDQEIGVVSVDPGDMRTEMHQAAFPGEDISDRPLPEETLPFWAWLLGQETLSISGQRFQAQADLWQVPA
jgi:NAD(P)-dependent dehydrogenase (short-subunit alcohol dehydrogenase family)